MQNKSMKLKNEHRIFKRVMKNRKLRKRFKRWIKDKNGAPLPTAKIPDRRSKKHGAKRVRVF